MEVPPSGGEVGAVGTASVPVLPHFYSISGLPAGLSFDATTRTVSGTPIDAGVFTVTCTAEDADADRSAADTATQTFAVRVQVGDRPRINRALIVSHPTFDSDGDGANDTYVQGDDILIDVEFGSNQPVAIGGVGDVQLRLDLGTDDTDLTNSRKVLTLDSDSVLHGGETLRFVHTVEAADTDADGVWVRTGDSNQVLFTTGTATIAHADTGAAASLTLGGLPTTGNPRARVDGTKTDTDIGPKPTGATVNGATLKVTFDENLDRPSVTGNTDDLRLNLAVQGAGGIDGGNRGARQHPEAISLSTDARTLTLTLSVAARADDTVTLTYTGRQLKGAGTGGIQAPMFRDLAVTNNTTGAKGPAPVHASAAEKTLRVIFDEALDAASTTAGSAFQVVTAGPSGDGQVIAGTGTAAIDGKIVKVTLAAGLRADELATVSYTKPGSAPLRSAATGHPEVQSVDRFRVGAVSDGEPPALLGGAVAPTQPSPPRSKAALYFDEPLDTTSVPAAGDFSVVVGDNAATVLAVAVESNNVVLTLDTQVTQGTAVVVSYTPGTDKIQDVAGNAAAAFRQTLSATGSGAPALTSATLDGARIELTFDRPLDPASTPAPEAFSLHLAPVAGQDADDPYGDIARVAVEGRKVVLHLENPMFPCGAPMTAPYSRYAGSAGQLKGLDGTVVAGFARQSVTNLQADLCRRWFESARMGSIILRAKRPFATDTAPQAAWFTVTASGGPVTVTGAAFSADDPYELKLELSRDIAPGETVTVSYRRPRGERGLWDVDGNQLADIVDRPGGEQGAGRAAGAERGGCTGRRRRRPGLRGAP